MDTMSSKTIVAVDEIRAGLARHKQTQTDLATHLGLSRTGIYRRLNGRTPFTVDELAATSELLEVPMSALIGPRTEGLAA